MSYINLLCDILCYRGALKRLAVGFKGGLILTKERARWGAARVRFLALAEEIRADMARGWSRTMLYERYQERLDCTYAAFTRLCRAHIEHRRRPRRSATQSEVSLPVTVPLAETSDALQEMPEPQIQPRVAPGRYVPRKLEYDPYPSEEKMAAWLRPVKPKTGGESQ